MSDSHESTMSDSHEPPAKRARLEADAPFSGVSFDTADSPVDDLDDDFYDNAPINPAAQAAPLDGSAASLTATAPAPSGFSLPGLGSLADTTVAVPQPQPQPQPLAQADADTVMSNADAVHDEGELVDEAALHHETSAVEPPVANQLQALVEAPQHGKPSRPELHAASLTPAQDAPATTATLSPALDAEAHVTAVAPHVDAHVTQEPSAAAAPAEGAPEPTADESKAEFLRIGEANKDNEEAEWQLDSDASSSSSDSSSSDDSSDDEADDGELMDPEEMVRLLMAESGDDAGASGNAKVKTLNEEEEKYEKPDIKVENETQITQLGKVEAVVDNLILVKATMSGDDKVLESGSALCLRDFTIIGKISEQIGRVEEPRYSVGFNDPAEITTLGIAKDTLIYYVDAHSTFVFTEPLRKQKHTDASNLHDEETNDVEFSDDEAEAEYKRQQKQAKKARQEAKHEPEPTPVPEQKPIPTGPRGHVNKPVSYFSPATEYQGGGLKYSDDEDEDLGMYKPLARPSHFEEIVGQGAPLEDRSHVRRGMMRGRGGWGDRGRGFRGRGNFGGRGDFGGGRGDFGGGRGGRGDAHGGRGDRGGGRGGRGGNSHTDQGRPQNQQQNQQQNSRQMSVPRPDHRSAASASPARQQEGQPPSQPQHSPPAKSKNKNRKARQREKREREAQERLQNQQQQAQQQPQQQPQQQQQAQKQHQQQHQQPQQQHASPVPSGPSNATSYANNSTAGWPAQFSQPVAPAAAAYPPPPPPAAATASYASPAQYAQQPAAPAQPGQQANWAAWAQWLQVVAMSQQGAQAPQAQAPPPQPQPQPQHYAQPPVQVPTPPQTQAQYGYQQQQWQYPQNAAPAPNPNAPQGNTQAGAQSLQDILRALGGGGGGQA